MYKHVEGKDYPSYHLVNWEWAFESMIFLFVKDDCLSVLGYFQYILYTLDLTSVIEWLDQTVRQPKLISCFNNPILPTAFQNICRFFLPCFSYRRIPLNSLINHNGLLILNNSLIGHCCLQSELWLVIQQLLIVYWWRNLIHFISIIPNI